MVLQVVRFIFATTDVSHILQQVPVQHRIKLHHYPKVVIRSSGNFPSGSAASLLQAGDTNMHSSAYLHEVVGRLSADELGNSTGVKHLQDAVLQTEAWATSCLE